MNTDKSNIVIVNGIRATVLPPHEARAELLALRDALQDRAQFLSDPADLVKVYGDTREVRAAWTLGQARQTAIDRFDAETPDGAV